jgi:hypothetical protein
MDVATAAGINAMLGATPGAVTVIYGGVTGNGHEGLPPDVAFEDPDVTSGQPAVVVAADYFPRIGVDRVEGIEGVAGTEIRVGDHMWRISRVLRAAPDGGTVLLLLTHPD